MIDFEKIRRDTLEFLDSRLPPVEQRNGVQQLIAALDEGIALGCMKAIKEYHNALHAPQDLPQDAK